MCHEALIDKLATNPCPGLSILPGSEEKAWVISGRLPREEKFLAKQTSPRRSL